jgi:hypothetical protein
MTEENRLDRIERAIEANARAIGALANSLQRISAPTATEAPRAPIPAHLVSDPIDALQDRLQELVSEKFEEIEGSSNALWGDVLRILKLLRLGIVDRDFLAQLKPGELDKLSTEGYLDATDKENVIEEFDRRLKAIEEKLSRLDN